SHDEHREKPQLLHLLSSSVATLEGGPQLRTEQRLQKHCLSSAEKWWQRDKKSGDGRLRNWLGVLPALDPHTPGPLCQDCDKPPGVPQENPATGVQGDSPSPTRRSGRPPHCETSSWS